jgi:hypothetical protein
VEDEGSSVVVNQDGIKQKNPVNNNNKKHQGLEASKQTCSIPKKPRCEIEANSCEEVYDSTMDIIGQTEIAASELDSYVGHSDVY